MATKRSTSTQAAANNVANAATTVKPPAVAGKLDKDELLLFNMYIHGKAVDDWFEHELLHVAQLAQLSAHINRAKKQLKLEGDITVNARGTEVANPRFYVVDSLVRQQLAMTRALGLSSSAAQKKEHVKTRAKTENETRGKVKNKSKLLAVPNK